ncbi:MAG: hypothetical protein BWZ01_01785 [Deltaproteobacteria bacterium ADurb.BinA179]|nr:MAG: hypothetical protein BWZ01_01785 [Deltaproteobacteria bacterium ADurb.BinA179]
MRISDRIILSFSRPSHGETSFFDAASSCASRSCSVIFLPLMHDFYRQCMHDFFPVMHDFYRQCMHDFFPVMHDFYLQHARFLPVIYVYNQSINNKCIKAAKR